MANERLNKSRLQNRRICKERLLRTSDLIVDVAFGQRISFVEVSCVTRKSRGNPRRLQPKSQPRVQSRPLQVSGAHWPSACRPVFKFPFWSEIVMLCNYSSRRKDPAAHHRTQPCSSPCKASRASTIGPSQYLGFLHLKRTQHNATLLM